jgi:two-component system, cell cycle sensor histidine kinase and response regulator CckA
MSPDSPPPPSSPAEGGSETILVIEDDADVRGMITKILSRYGYTTFEAATGVDGIRLFGEHRGAIGLVLLDVVMPGANGREGYDDILRMDPYVKVIFMSGYARDVVIDKGVRQDGVDFLQKPLLLKSLLAKVREVLDK